MKVAGDLHELRPAERAIQKAEDAALASAIRVICWFSVASLTMFVAALLAGSLPKCGVVDWVASLADRYFWMLGNGIHHVHENWAILILLAAPAFIRVVRKQLEAKRPLGGAPWGNAGDPSGKPFADQAAPNGAIP